MTNNEIIFWASVDLMNEGKIGSTGRVFKGVDRNGNEVELPEPETIHTFQAWKALGFSVKKGQKAVAAIRIWKHTTKVVELPAKDAKTGEDITVSEEASQMFMKTAFFFSASQVEKTTAKKTA